MSVEPQARAVVAAAPGREDAQGREDARAASKTEGAAFDDGREAGTRIEPEQPDYEAATLSSLPLLRLQSVFKPRADGRCRVEELLMYHDRAFVESAYAATLGRAPEASELAATLADLRASRRGKIEIIEDLARSPEGARAGASERIEGIGGADWKRRVRRLPVVGYLWQLLSSIVRLPVALRHRQEFETYALAQQQLIADHFNEQQQQLAWFFDEQRMILYRHIADELQRAVADANAATSMLSDALAELSGRLSDARHGFDLRLDAQQEFLTREQQAIVEAQKAVLAEIEMRLGEAQAARDRALSELTRSVRELRASLEGTRAAEGESDAGRAEGASVAHRAEGTGES